jgi:hypothetical protein
MPRLPATPPQLRSGSGYPAQLNIPAGHPVAVTQSVARPPHRRYREV